MSDETSTTDESTEQDETTEVEETEEESTEDEGSESSEEQSEESLEEVKARLKAAEDKLAKAKQAEESDVKKQLDETQDQLAKLQKAERKREFVAKAADYKNLGDPKQVATLLMAADEHFSDAEEKILKRLLDGASEQVEAGALFKQLSDPDAEVDESPEVSIEKAARKLMEGDENLTIEQAKVKAVQDNPDLAKSYASKRS